MGVRFRRAGVADAGAVAALHADSWRRHYRGAYSDAFLDGDVTADRRDEWSRRLNEPGPGDRTLLAEDDDSLVGFAHVVLDADPASGALVDNLHVSHARKRGGLGTGLLRLVGRRVQDDGTDPRLFLWVLAQNTGAQAFYRAMGATEAGSKHIGAPGGDGTRIVGSPVALRMVWPDVGVLVRGTEQNTGQPRRSR